MERVVAALVAADRPRAAGIPCRGGQRVVPPLAVRDADRVHGRQVDDVEAELGQLRQHLGRRPEAAPRRAGRARTRIRTARALARRRPRAASRATSSPVGRFAPSTGACARHASTSSSSAPKSAAPSESSPARSSWPAASLRSSSSSQRRVRIDPGLDRVLPAAELGRRRNRPPSDRCRLRLERPLPPTARAGGTVRRTTRGAGRDRPGRSSPRPPRGRRPSP